MSEHDFKRGCPSNRELELFTLDEMAADKTRAIIRDHLPRCPRCQRKYRHFRAFYATLSRELDNSFPPQLIEYAKHRASRQVKYGLLICIPQPNHSGFAGNAFLATLAFAANGDGSKSQLIDFDLPGDGFGIMLYSDPQRKELLLFLQSPRHKNCDQWTLFFPVIGQQPVFNGYGFAKIPLTHFENLHNQLCYLAVASKKKKPQRVMDKIQALIV